MKKILSLCLIIVISIFLAGCTLPFRRNSTAGLQVITDNSPATIFLDNQYLDKTPYIGKEIKPGTYTLKIQPDDAGLIPYETSITLRSGLLTVVTWKPGARPELGGGVIYELEKLNSKKQTEVSVVSIPDGAIINLDAGPKEFAPVLLKDISPGTHNFSVSLPSYDSQEHTINVVEGHRLNILIKLAKSVDMGEAGSTKADQLQPSTTATTSALNSSQSATTSTGVLPTGANKSGTIKIDKTGFFENGQEVLRVRDQAGPSGKQLGFAKVGENFPYLNQTTNGWFKISFNNKEGWVSGTYATLVE